MLYAFEAGLHCVELHCVGRSAGLPVGQSLQAQQTADGHFTGQALSLLQNIETLKYLKASFLLYFSLPTVHSRRCNN
jgi:hypothetical protein